MTKASEQKHIPIDGVKFTYLADGLEIRYNRFSKIYNAAWVLIGINIVIFILSFIFEVIPKPDLEIETYLMIAGSISAFVLTLFVLNLRRVIFLGKHEATIHSGRVRFLPGFFHAKIARKSIEGFEVEKKTRSTSAAELDSPMDITTYSFFLKYREESREKKQLMAKGQFTSNVVDVMKLVLDHYVNKKNLPKASYLQKRSSEVKRSAFVLLLKNFARYFFTWPFLILLYLLAWLVSSMGEGYQQKSSLFSRYQKLPRGLISFFGISLSLTGLVLIYGKIRYDWRTFNMEGADAIYFFILSSLFFGYIVIRSELSRLSKEG